MTLSPEWVSIVAPFASGAFGVGMAYGILRQNIITLKASVDKMEKKLEKQVGEDRCDKMRSECHDNMCELIDAKLKAK